MSAKETKPKKQRTTAKLSITSVELLTAVNEFIVTAELSKGPLKPVVFLKSKANLQSQYTAVMDDLASPSGAYLMYKSLRYKVSVAKTGKLANEPAGLETKIEKRKALMAVSQSELEDLQNNPEAVKEACDTYKKHAFDMQGLLTELADELESLQYQKTTMTSQVKRVNSKLRYAREKVFLRIGVSAFERLVIIYIFVFGNLVNNHSRTFVLSALLF